MKIINFDKNLIMPWEPPRLTGMLPASIAPQIHHEEELVVFEVPSSMRTITIKSLKINRYHLCLPRMRFVAWIKNIDCYWLLKLYGVFLDRDGEVYPMMLPNIGTTGSVCFGEMEKNYSLNNLNVFCGEIYSNFIQSEFTNEGYSIFRFLDLLNGANKFSSSALNYEFDRFYGGWSYGGKNYDICSDLRVKRHREYIRERETWLDGSVYKKYLSMGPVSSEF